MSDMISILKQARPDLLKLTGYVSARMSESDNLVLLNANENPNRPQPERANGADLNRYPDPQPAELKARMAGLYEVDVAQLLVTRGSDEAIDLLIRAFCRAGVDAIVQCSPCFGMYAASARIQGAHVIDCALISDENSEWEVLDIEAIFSAVSEQNARMVFITQPNNPTGRLIELAQIEALLQACADKAMVVIDEAYIEFAGIDSSTGLLNRYEHLVVLRTLSKAFALAGARCGCAIAHPEVIHLLRQIMPPYPLPSPSIEAAELALSENSRASMSRQVEQIRQQRARLQQTLSHCRYVQHQWHSVANFILLRVTAVDALYDWLLKGGIIVRNFSDKPGLEGCLRISIGSEAENSQLISLLEDFIP